MMTKPTEAEIKVVSEQGFHLEGLCDASWYMIVAGELCITCQMQDREVCHAIEMARKYIKG